MDLAANRDGPRPIAGGRQRRAGVDLGLRKRWSRGQCGGLTVRVTDRTPTSLPLPADFQSPGRRNGLSGKWVRRTNSLDSVGDQASPPIRLGFDGPDGPLDGRAGDSGIASGSQAPRDCGRMR